MEIRLNIEFKSEKTSSWHDSEVRSEHIFDRMRLRGIYSEQIKEAVQKGAKRFRKDGSIISDYRWFRLIYREFRLGDIRKIYPITVYEV